MDTCQVSKCDKNGYLSDKFTIKYGYLPGDRNVYLSGELTIKNEYLPGELMR